MLSKHSAEVVLDSKIVSKIDELISSAMLTGVNFDETSKTTQLSMFSLAASRAELLKMLTE